MNNAQDVLHFWFDPSNQPFWFQKNTAFDKKLSDQFSELLIAASHAELWSWRISPEGRLAEIIVLDQFSRNIYRDQPAAFAQDALALALSQEAIRLEVDQQLAPEQRSFLYMPFMHSESVKIHEFALMLFERLGNPINLDFEKKHKVIIDRFGRYPHRNQILGRESSAEELEFLQQPYSNF